MNRKLGVWSAGMVLSGLGFWALLAEHGNADDSKTYKDGVLKIAAALQSRNLGQADKMAAGLAKKIEDLGDFMELFKARNKGGLGVGSKPGVALPDGIELKLIALGRDAPSPASLKKEAGALEQMGYDIAAMANVARYKPDSKAKKDWKDWCDDLVVSSVKFSDAAKNQEAAAIKTLASKIHATCNSCHSEYRK